MDVFPASLLCLLPPPNDLYHVLLYTQSLNQMVVEDAHAACRDSPHREFLVAGNTQLAHDEDIEGGAEGAGNFIRDGYAAARKAQHKNVRLIGVSGELCREVTSRLATITKGPRLHGLGAHNFSSPCAQDPASSGAILER